MQHAINKQTNISTAKHIHLCQTNKYYSEPHVSWSLANKLIHLFKKTSTFQSFWDFRSIDEKITTYNNIYFTKSQIYLVSQRYTLQWWYLATQHSVKLCIQCISNFSSLKIKSPNIYVQCRKVEKCKKIKKTQPIIPPHRDNCY